MAEIPDGHLKTWKKYLDSLIKQKRDQNYFLSQNELINPHYNASETLLYLYANVVCLVQVDPRS